MLRTLLFVASALIVVLLTKYFRDGFDGIEENLAAVLDLRWAGVNVGIGAAPGMSLGLAYHLAVGIPADAPAFR